MCIVFKDKPIIRLNFTLVLEFRGTRRTGLRAGTHWAETPGNSVNIVQWADIVPTIILHFHHPWRSFRLGGRNDGSFSVYMHRIKSLFLRWKFALFPDSEKVVTLCFRLK